MDTPFRAIAKRLLGFSLVLTLLPAGANAQAADRGYYWTQVTPSGPWSPRTSHAAVSFKGRLWVIGGGIGGDIANDVWSSTDGYVWKLETNDITWLNGRGKGRIVVFGDKLWVVGNYAAPNDVWCSPDGITWTQVVSDAPWAARYGAGIAVYQDKLWVLGGGDFSGTQLNDVWSSSDGIQWSQVSEHSAWTPRHVNTVVFQDRLWVLGGYFIDTSLVFDWACRWLHDAVSSSTGESWTTIPSVGVGYFGTLAVFDNQLWDTDRSYFYEVFLAGLEAVGSNEVWCSQDAAHWKQMPAAPWTVRRDQASVVFDGKLWVLGGVSDGPPSGAKNDVWNLTAVSLNIDTGQRYLYNLGEPMTLKLTASALSGAVHYQWLKNDNALPDATSDTYHVDAFTAEDAGAYTCELTGDTFGSAGPVQIGLAPPKVPAACPFGLAAGVMLTALGLIFRKRIMPSRP